MSIGPIWQTPAGFLFTATELVTTSTQVAATGTNVTYSLISGNLPTGLNISSTGTISGIPDPVLNLTKSTFVIRANNQFGVKDRTFNIDVTGKDAPVWSTDSGYTNKSDYDPVTAYIAIGPLGEHFAINNQYVHYQFVATSTQDPYGTKIKFYISENGGELPPGLHLSQEGLLSGFLKDTLVFDGDESDTGGYDEESYDGYAYDHGLVQDDAIGVPKIYQFKITATNGVASSDRLFKIIVVSPDMIRHTDLIQMTLEPGIIYSDPNYLPPVQFIKGTDLGIIRAENNEVLDVSAYDPYPKIGTVSYNVIEGPTEFTQLPNFLNIDHETGTLYGYVPYQPAYTKNYNITVAGTRVYSTSSITSTNTFTLAVRGQVESTIEWVTSSTLGTITVGETSELAVVARQINSDYSIKYNIINGEIPPGLTLERDGSLSGNVDYGTTGTFIFEIRAQDVHELSAIDREFKLDVIAYNNKKYTKMWVRPFMPLDKRNIYRDFMINEFVFPQKSMYRYFDPNFGVQTEIKMVLEFGIEQKNLADYLPALRENFYRRRFYFGDVKIAVAKTISGDSIYEVVYVDVVDEMINNNGVDVNPVLHTNNDIYYPSSIGNMRRQLKNLVNKPLEQITLDNVSFISINERNQPLFMRTPQLGSYQPPGYMHLIPLCYVLPGEGSKIVSRIKLSQFNFKQFDLDIDRLIVDDTLDNSTAKYLLFPRQNIGDMTQDDKILYGPDTFAPGDPDDRVLDEQDGILNLGPINRE